MELIFWICFVVVGYTFFGYAILLFLMVQIKRVFRKSRSPKVLAHEDYPDVCLFITAYNEIDFVDSKVQNSFSLNYPKDKIQYLWITDGSNDGTPERLQKYPELEVHHLDERKGKMHAMNRGMQFVRPSIVVFSDCNTLLGENSVIEIVNEFRHPEVGCIAGEKRIVEKKSDDAAGAGEGAYWKFESWIKCMDSELNTTVGAVGELFAIRRELYEPVENDTLLDDFIISMRIASKGYKISYLPNAYALETASVNVTEEMKRKIRIAAGGIQSVFRLFGLLNPIKYGMLSFQFFSHKVLRWTISPFLLFGLLIINFLILLSENKPDSYSFLSLFFYLQLFMYFVAFLGFLFGRQKLSIKWLFIPYYFVSMNYAAIAGWWRFLKGNQTVVWEKAKRA